MPGIIGERLFSVFDKNKDDYINKTEFIDSIMKLYASSFDDKLRIVFDIYDTDSDNYLAREEVKLVLSYAPIKTTQESDSIDKEGRITQDEECNGNYYDRAESQNQLSDLINLCFGAKPKIDFLEFKEITEKVTSELFLCIFSLLKTHFPSVAQFKRYDQKLKRTKTLLSSPKFGHKLAAPRTLSKFSSISEIAKFSTPKLRSNQFANRQVIEEEISDQSEGPTAQLPYVRLVCPNTKLGQNATPDATPDLKRMASPLPSIINNQTVRCANAKFKTYNVINTPTTFLNGKDNFGPTLFCECGKPVTNYDKILCDKCLQKLDTTNHEGYLYVEEKSDLCKYWFVLENKDFYCYESQDSLSNKTLNNLIGCFITTQPKKPLAEGNIYPFTIIFSPTISKTYYANTKESLDVWTEKIRKVIGYSNMSDYYELKETIGRGKFGLVKLAIHKKTGKKVAIKIMSKLSMKKSDIDLMRQEIEIMKMCQHPNIIRLLDVFESIEHTYIVMELLKGGDLFSYLEKRKFHISEQTASRIIHSLAAGLYYLHSYGIIHRDLKPENILMVNNTSESDVKIMDFGLSKIVGPADRCNEPYGTLSYVAPEVLQKTPYNMAVDIWSLGIITHLMLIGYLPFDHENDQEIAR